MLKVCPAYTLVHFLCPNRLIFFSFLFSSFYIHSFILYLLPSFPSFCIPVLTRLSFLARVWFVKSHCTFRGRSGESTYFKGKVFWERWNILEGHFKHSTWMLCELCLAREKESKLIIQVSWNNPRTGHIKRNKWANGKKSAKFYACVFLPSWKKKFPNSVYQRRCGPSAHKAWGCCPHLLAPAFLSAYEPVLLKTPRNTFIYFFLGDRFLNQTQNSNFHSLRQCFGKPTKAKQGRQ